MAREQRLALEDRVALRLKQTNREPAEWIGELRDGSRVHIVADTTALRIAIGTDLNAALIAAKSNDVTRVLHKYGSKIVPTNHMLDVTGLLLASGVVVNSAVPGDLS